MWHSYIEDDMYSYDGIRKRTLKEENVSGRRLSKMGSNKKNLPGSQSRRHKILIRSIGRTILLGLSIMVGATFCFGQRLQNQKRNAQCDYWLSKVQADFNLRPGQTQLDESNPQNVVDGIACLIRFEGNKHKGAFGGAMNSQVSQLFEPATVELDALYYISYLYFQKWDHANAVGLREHGEFNKPGTIRRAYKYYRAWYKQVNIVGLERTRGMHQDPLKNTDISWY